MTNSPWSTSIATSMALPCILEHPASRADESDLFLSLRPKIPGRRPSSSSSPRALACRLLAAGPSSAPDAVSCAPWFHAPGLMQAREVFLDLVPAQPTSAFRHLPRSIPVPVMGPLFLDKVHGQEGCRAEQRRDTSRSWLKG